MRVTKLLTARVKEIASSFRVGIFGGLAWSAFGSVSLQGLTVISSFVLSRTIGLSEFGAYSLITSAVMVVVNLAQGGSGFLASKVVAENRSLDLVATSRVLSLCDLVTNISGAIFALAVAVCSSSISKYIFGTSDHRTAIAISSFAIFFNVRIVFQTGALQGFSAFKEIGRWNAASGVASIFCVLSGAMLAGLQGSVFGFCLAAAMRMIFFRFALRATISKNSIPRAPDLRRDDLRMFWTLAVPSALAGLVTMPSLWLVNLSISRLDDGLYLTGVFAAATQARQVALQLPILMNAVTFSAMSQNKKINGIDYKKIHLANTYAGLLFSSVAAVSLFLFASPILSLWGERSGFGVAMLRILAVSVVFEAVAMSLYQRIQVSGSMWKSLLLLAIPRDLTYAASAVFLMSLVGAVGAPIAFTFSQVIGLFATILIIKASSEKKDG